MQLIASIVSQPWAVWAFGGALTIWAFWSGGHLWKHTQQVTTALGSLTSVLRKAPDALAFARDFETINDEMARHAILGGRWRDFAASLVMPRSTARPIRATARASLWFDTGILRAGKNGLNLRYHNALPNLLVGAGLLFTFLGLAAALSTAGDVVAGASEQRNVALKTLLDAASFKFITSLVGLLLSILYTILVKARLKRVDGALDGFLLALEERVPLLTPAALQEETNDILQRQSSQLEQFGTDLAINIGQAFDRAFDNRLGEHVGPLVEVMRSLREGMSNRNEEALQTMLNGFVAKLEGGAGGVMQDVADSLSGFGARLEGLQAGLSDAAQRMSQAADAMSARLGEGADAAVGQMNGRIAELAQTLQAIADQTRAAGADASRDLMAGIQASAASFEATAGRIAAVMERSAADTGSAFGRGAEDAVERIAAATEGMRAAMQAMLAELRSAMGQASETLRAGGAAGAEALRGSLGDAAGSIAASIGGAAQRLEAAGAAAADALRGGGAGAGDEIVRAGGVFTGRAEALASQVSALARASDELGQRLSKLERATGDASAPLAAGAADLRSAGQAARAAAEPLSQVAQAIGRSIDGLNVAAQRLENACGVAADLSRKLESASQQFSGVDKSLAGAVSELQTGLTGFTRQVSSFVKDTDQNLARAATQLGNLVKGLQDTIEDLRSN